MPKLNATEQSLVNDAKQVYVNLSADAKTELAKGVSWAERNIWNAVLAAAVVGAIADHLVRLVL